MCIPKTNESRHAHRMETSFMRLSMSIVPAEDERRTIVGSNSLQNSSILTSPDLSSSSESACIACVSAGLPAPAA